jgi:hypothetical protein
MERNLQYNIETSDGIGKMYETRVKDLVWDAVDKHGFNVREILGHTFECPDKTLMALLQPFGDVYSGGHGSMLVLSENCMIKTDTIRDEGTPRFKLWFMSKTEHVPEIRDRLLEVFKQHIYNKMALDVAWAVQSRGGIDYIDMQTELNDIVYSEAYPYIPELDKFIAGYFASSSPILLMLGPAGTGKTRLIKHIMKRLGDLKNKNWVIEDYSFDDDDVLTDAIDERAKGIRNPRVLYTMEPKVFEEDGFFIRFLGESFDAMVLEDIDLKLAPRKDGNEFMHKILAGSDGIIRSNRRKIIFTTNWGSEDKMDAALLRPGRCHAVINTRPLSKEEAAVLALKLGKSLEGVVPNKHGEYTLAEIYNLGK